MEITSVSVFHFSPTGSSERIANRLAASLSTRVEEFDLSAQTLARHSVSGKSLAIVAVPVYRGRVPARAVEAIRLISGNGAYCVSLVVYGNRAYEDALIELNDLLTERGFRVFSSAAFIAQHSIIEEIAAGRPDAQDFAVLNDFAASIHDALFSERFNCPPEVPGNRPYIESPSQPLTPLATEACDACGACARGCPVSAIPKDDPKQTDSQKCILCMRCIRQCPSKARILPPPYREAVATRLQAFRNRREPEIYV